jgi:hypothetical protein
MMTLSGCVCHLEMDDDSIFFFYLQNLSQPILLDQIPSSEFECETEPGSCVVCMNFSGVYFDYT